MDKQQFIEICNLKLKLIRTEYELSQEKMSQIIGISKKTLVEIEKGRSSLGWMGSVVLVTIFAGSGILSASLAASTDEIIRSLAFENIESRSIERTGRIWWQTIKQNEKFIIEQNIVSQHYRIITVHGTKISSSFELDDLEQIFNHSE